MTKIVCYLPVPWLIALINSQNVHHKMSMSMIMMVTTLRVHSAQHLATCTFFQITCHLDQVILSCCAWSSHACQYHMINL